MLLNPSCKISAIDSLYYFVAEEMKSVNDTLLSIANHSTTDLIKVVSDYLMNAGGKRLRPLLSLVIAKAMLYEGNKHIALASAVELIHAATLLHDDVIDESKQRRKMPSANLIWGNKTSILVGDYIFSKAFQLMVNTNSIEILDTLANAANVIAATEVWQLQLIGNIDINIDQYFSLIEGKTAALFAASCKSGAILANVNENNLHFIHVFGQNLGIIFQVIDDFLDYFSTEEGLGKKPMQDFLEQKITLPLIILRDIICNQKNNSATEDRNQKYHDITKCNSKKYNHINQIINHDQLKKIIQNQNSTEILQIMQEAQITNYLSCYIEKYVEQAICAIKKVDFGQYKSVQDDLISLVHELSLKCNNLCISAIQ